MKLTKKQFKSVCKKLNSKLIRKSFLGRGAHNENFLLETDKGKFVLRIENNLHFKNIKREYRFLKKTEGEFGPKVFLFDDSKKIISKDYLVEEFLVGTHPPKKVTDDFIQAMAKWYSQIHKNKKKELPNLPEERNWVRRHAKSKKFLKKDVREDLDVLCEKAREIFVSNRKLFLDRTASLNHGDPSRENIFYENSGVRLIDWEFVGYDFPEADLVFFVWSYDLSDKQKNLFLKTYGYKRSKKRFEIMFLTHILAMISWYVERLGFVIEKKIDKNQSCSTEKEIYHEININIPRAKKVLRSLK